MAAALSEALELRGQLEKERKRAKEELKTVQERHRGETRRLQTEKENHGKRVEAACELKLKRMQEQLDEARALPPPPPPEATSTTTA